MIHFECAKADLRRLTSLRRRAWAQRRVCAIAEYDREINALLKLSWPCSDPGCSDLVTLGMYAAQRVETTQ